MRVLWLKAPLLLRRHPPVLAAVVVVSLLAALAAAASPLVRAGVETESLQGEFAAMSPLSAGLEVDDHVAKPIAGDVARRAAARRVSAPHVGGAVVSSRTYVQVANASGNGFDLLAVARTNAVAHVTHLASSPGGGVWISSSTAKATGLKPGGTIRLTVQQLPRVPTVSFRVAGIYEQLDADLSNPYWLGWAKEIRPQVPWAPTPPAFVLMSEAQLVHLARVVSPYAYNRYEYPVIPRGLTVPRTKALSRELHALGARLTGPRSPLGCYGHGCAWSTSLDAALVIASHDVAAVAPTVSLLSSCGLLIALALAVATGVFCVRRRSDEAQALFARGEAPASFALRTAVEAILPAVLGGALGVGAAILSLRALAPAGSLDHGSLSSGIWRAAGGAALSVTCIALGAAAAFPRRGSHRHFARWLRHIPWEVVPLAAAAGFLALVLSGGGVTHDVNGAGHPTLVVFLVPVVAVAGIGGLLVRALRAGLRPVRAERFLPVYLGLRRLAAARGLLVTVVVAAAVGFGTFAYAATLASSLDRSVNAKAYVSNGSNVQAVIDPSEEITSPFGFPTAIVEVDESNVSLPDGTRVDLIAGDPAAMARTIAWHAGLGPDPRPLLARLRGPGLPAIATGGSAHVDAIVDQGARIPITVVGHALFPGVTAGRPALVVSRAALRRVAHRRGILDPGPLAEGLLWAKGSPRPVETALAASNLAPTYFSTLDHLLTDPDVAAARRSYRYVELIGAAALVLALLALGLYLQARQRAQSIASAFARQMGLAPAADAAAVALESAAIAAFAAVAGGVVAVFAARPIASKVDALPAYAPSPIYNAPIGVIVATAVGVVLAGAVLGIAATFVAARSDVAEALRVA